MKLSFTILKYLVYYLGTRDTGVQVYSLIKVAKKEGRAERRGATDELQEMW
jgi:hypothetical protein